MATSQFFISPSRLARYFFHDCDRHLRYHSTPSKGRKAEGIPSYAHDKSPVTAAILEGGYFWEEKVVTQHLKGRVRIPKGKAALHERSHSFAESLVHLESLRPGEALYQPTLEVPASFGSRYGLAPGLVSFPPCRPDLLLGVGEDDQGRTLVRIVDIKARLSKALS